MKSLISYLKVTYWLLQIETKQKIHHLQVTNDYQKLPLDSGEFGLLTL